MRVGFACSWWDPPQPSWSYLPWNLRAAIGARNDVDLVDLPVQPPAELERALRGIHRRLRPRVPEGAWRVTFPHDWLTERRLRSATRRESPDVVLEITDLGSVSVPFFVCVDLTYDLIGERLRDLPRRFFPMAALDPKILVRRQREQHRIIGSSAGVFARSQWVADAIVRHGLAEAGRVHVTYVGRNSVGPGAIAELSGREYGSRLLFVGRNFFQKGGDLAVAALDILRRNDDPSATLTVVGPDSWPLPGPVPPGVDFRGRILPEEVGRLYMSHDLFLFPSRFEALGISMIEALGHGLPCIGRNDFAMPEVIEPGVNGYLLNGDSPEELARLAAQALQNMSLRTHTRKAAAAFSERFSWSTIAGEMVEVMRSWQ